MITKRFHSGNNADENNLLFQTEVEFLWTLSLLLREKKAGSNSISVEQSHLG